MMQMELIKKVRKMLDENTQIDEFFHPLIEVFFIRLQEQYGLDDEQINKLLEKYYTLDAIEFKDIDRNSLGRFQYTIDYIGNDGKINLLIGNKQILFNYSIIRGILLNNKKMVSEFINTAFHEQGHLIQLIKKDDIIECGLDVSSADDRTSYIINEFAEIINAERLEKGELSEKKYSGYECIQSICRVIINSLGISEKEFGDLQMLGNGREEYENLLTYIIGENSEPIITTLETALDTIHSIYCSIGNKIFIKKDLKQNLVFQYDTIIKLSNEILKRRFERADKSNVEEIAKIVLDKEKRDENLQEAIKDAKWRGLPLNFKANFESEMVKKVVGEEINERQIKDEVKRLKDEENKKQSEIAYDNTNLINRLLLGLLSYDFSNFPEKERRKIEIYKNIGLLKRKLLNRDIPVIEDITSARDTREVFVKRLTYSFDKEIEKKGVLKSNESRDDKDANIRKDRY